MKKNLYDELIPFSKISYRDIYKRFIYVDCRELLEEII